MNNKKKRELTNEEIDENIFGMCNICSTTDCTGLIQVVPRTEAELESYEELYPFRPPFYLVMMIKSSSVFSCNKILWPVMTIRSCFNVHFLF